MAWFASNFLPFSGAMSRRAISIYLKHSIPEEFLDSTLRERMFNDTPQQQLKAIHAYNALISKYDKPILNQVWPNYFKKQQIEMENTSQPLCAFLRDLANHTRSGWHVVRWDTAAMREQRMKNYVPISKIQYFFQRWCSTTGMSSRWDPIQWQEAMDANHLKVRNKTLPWVDAANQAPENIKRDYVFGILDPAQPNQPGSGSPMENEIDELDDDDDIQDLDISEAIQINGMSLHAASESQDQLGVLRGINNVLQPEIVSWLWDIGVVRRKRLGGRQMKKNMKNAIVKMIEDSGLSKDILAHLSENQQGSSSSSKKRRR